MPGQTQRSQLALCTPHMHVHMHTHMHTHKHTHMPCTLTQVKPGKGPAFVRTTLKNLETGASRASRQYVST